MNWEKTFVHVLVILGPTLCMFMAYFFGEHFTGSPLSKSRLGTLWSYLLGGGKAAVCMFILGGIFLVRELLSHYDNDPTQVINVLSCSWTRRARAWSTVSVRPSPTDKESPH